MVLWISVLALVPGLAAQAGTLPHPPRRLARLQPLIGQHGQVAAPGNFPFQTTVSHDKLVIIHTYARAAAFAQQVLALVQGDLAHPIADTLGFTLKRPVNIFIYNSRTDFLAGAQPDHPAETGAYAVPSQSTIYMPVEGANAADAQSYLPHELTHIVFHQNEDIGVFGATLYPLWLDEGNAAYDEVDAADIQSYVSTLQFATSNNTLIDLLTTFNTTYPTNADTDYLGYAEARGFIGYLISTYGAPAYHHFLRAVQDGDTILAAETVFGADPRLLQSRWRVGLGATPTVADAGYVPAATTAMPFVIGTMPVRASSLTPFALPQSASVLNLFIGIALWLLVEIAMLALVEVIMLTRHHTAQDNPHHSPRLRLEHIGVALLVPAALLVGLGWARYGPGQCWGCAALVAGGFGFVLLTMQLAANWRGLLHGRLAAARLTGLLAALTVAAIGFTQAQPLAWQQADDYARAGGYALALQMYHAVGASPAVLAAVHNEWAVEAQGIADYRTETAQLRAEIALLDAPATLKLHAQLLSATLTWGQGLTAAHQFAAASSVYADQAASTACDSVCHGALHTSQGANTLAWGDALLASGDTTGALTKYQLVVATDGASHAATTARAALAEVPAAGALASALATGAQGDAGTMNAALRTLVAHYPHTAAASEAPETAQPVTGRVQDQSGASESGQRVYFVAFIHEGDALNYAYNSATFTVATTIAPDGSFAVRLPAGYWYAPFWEDPTQPQAFNAPFGTSGVFAVPAYTPVDVGTLAGY